MPTTAPARHENRLAGIRFTSQRRPGTPEIRRLTTIGERKPEAKEPWFELGRMSLRCNVMACLHFRVTRPQE